MTTVTVHQAKQFAGVNPSGWAGVHPVPGATAISMSS